jgi:hypothetical protein
VSSQPFLLAHVGLDAECLLDPDLMHDSSESSENDSRLMSISTDREDFISRINHRDKNLCHDERYWS